MLGEEDDDEVVVDPDADLPPFKIRHNDMKIETLKLIVRSIVSMLCRSNRTY